MFRSFSRAELGVLALYTLALGAFCAAAFLARYVEHERVAGLVALTCTFALALFISGNLLMLLDRIGRSRPEFGPADREAIERAIAREYVATLPMLPPKPRDAPPDRSSGQDASNVRRFPIERRYRPSA